MSAHQPSHVFSRAAEANFRLRNTAIGLLPLAYGVFCVALVNLTLFTRLEWRGMESPVLSAAFIESIEAVLLTNLALLGLLWLVRRRILEPWQRMRQIMTQATTAMLEERGTPAQTRSLQAMATELARFTEYMQHAAVKYRHLEQELECSRTMLAQMDRQQQAIMANTGREVRGQYQHVLAYAHYLDEHIQHHQRDAQLRYDFDDVCESSFNLKLMMQSLHLLRRPAPHIEPVMVPQLLQQTLLSLAPALDRRSMKISTLGIDDALVVTTDVQLLAHAWWMMLLGTIRYAAEESTLRLRCLKASGGEQAILSLLVSELSPGLMTPDERQAHMVRQLQHATPHMFAETIRLHGNVQLAEMLLTRVGGRVDLLPISSYACEISMILPLAKK